MGPSYPEFRIYGFCICRFCIHRPWFRNSIFELPTTDSQSWIKNTIFDLQLVDCRVKSYTQIFYCTQVHTPNLLVFEESNTYIHTCIYKERENFFCPKTLSLLASMSLCSSKLLPISNGFLLKFLCINTKCYHVRGLFLSPLFFLFFSLYLSSSVILKCGPGMSSHSIVWGN